MTSVVNSHTFYGRYYIELLYVLLSSESQPAPVATEKSHFFHFFLCFNTSSKIASNCERRIRLIILRTRKLMTLG